MRVDPEHRPNTLKRPGWKRLKVGGKNGREKTDIFFGGGDPHPNFLGRRPEGMRSILKFWGGGRLEEENPSRRCYCIQNFLRFLEKNCGLLKNYNFLESKIFFKNTFSSIRKKSGLKKHNFWLNATFHFKKCFFKKK